MPNTTTFEYGNFVWNANATHSLKYDDQIECFFVNEISSQGVKTFRFVNDYDLNSFFEEKTHAKDAARYQPLSMASALEVGYEFDKSTVYVHRVKLSNVEYTDIGKYHDIEGKFCKDMVGKYNTALEKIVWFYPCDKYGLLDKQAHDAATAMGVTLWKEGE